LAASELRLLWCEDNGATIPRRERVDRLLRLALSPLVGVSPDQLRFGREAKGRPFLRHPEAPDFNLSDTRGGTLLAITRAGRVGVDLERTDRIPPALRLAQRWFATDEFAALETLPDSERTLAFLHLWTAKEASCKATGTGIFGFLPQWRFVTASPEPSLLALPDDAGTSARWRFLRLSPATGFTAVIALRDAATPTVRGFHFSLD
jgi:4'-phosphopantetheinyl transferase